MEKKSRFIVSFLTLPLQKKLLHAHQAFLDTVKKITKGTIFFPVVLRIFAFTFPSIILSLLFLEVMTRLFLHPSDAPDIYFDPVLGNTFVPNQFGTYLKGQKAEIKGQFRINNAGWNSPYDYTKIKSPDDYRIAVIGDSYVEALQVDYNKSYPYLIERQYLLEQQLNQKSIPVQVYTFGHSGASLAHYQHMVDTVSHEYNPDLVIITIVANDFKESLYGFNRKDNWSLSFTDSTFNEIPPQRINNLFWKRLLRHSAFVRYLTINLDLVNTSPIFNALFYGETRQHRIVDKNLEAAFAQDEFLQTLVEHILTNVSQISKNQHFKLLLVLDTDRNAIYSNTSIQKTESYRFNRTVEAVAKKLTIPVLNLTSTMEDDWQKHQTRFNWESDEHWNEYGHQVVAQAALKYIQSLLPSAR